MSEPVKISTRHTIRRIKRAVAKIVAAGDQKKLLEVAIIVNEAMQEMARDSAEAATRPGR